MKSGDDAVLHRRDEIRIDAPADEVWSVLTDIASWPAWMPGVKSAAADGPFSPGSRFRWKSGLTVISSEVSEAVPGRSATWRGSTPGIEAVHAWRLADRDAGGTFVETDESWSGLLPRLFPGPMGRTLAKALRETLAGLKAEAERRAGQSS